MKMEAYPEVRMETEERQSTEYEVHHQKLVNKHTLTLHHTHKNKLILSQTVQVCGLI